MALLTTNNPFMLGFDSLERMLDRAAKNSESYPPYNIEQIDPSIEVQDKQLTVSGRRVEDENASARRYLYRGIASRQFQRSFVLADGIEVEDAHLDNGLLHIDLKQNEPEQNIRQIKISKKEHGGKIEKPSEKAKIEKK